MGSTSVPLPCRHGKVSERDIPERLIQVLQDSTTGVSPTGLKIRVPFETHKKSESVDRFASLGSSGGQTGGL